MPSPPANKLGLGPVVEANQKPVTNMDFSEALYHLKSGAKLARGTWPKGDYLTIEHGSPEPLTLHAENEESSVWPINQFDVFADDWRII